MDSILTLWASSSAMTRPQVMLCSRNKLRHMLNSEQAVSGETQGQERSTMVNNPGYVCVKGFVAHGAWVSYLVLPCCPCGTFAVFPLCSVSRLWHKALKHGQALAERRELSWRKFCRQNFFLESLIIESRASRLLRHTHLPQDAIDSVNIERNTPFFWLDSHEIENSFRVESMTVNL